MPGTKKEQFEFQSEVKQLLNILVYSLYKNKEVFLRELVSNAVDALNKVQFEMLTSKKAADPEADLRIDITFNQTQNKLVIEDSGVGMTRAELIENLGTIAHSGTMDFLQRLTQAKEQEKVDLIGKFGVGFYSSFMVAKEIRLYTKSFRPGSPGLLWVSQGDTAYTIEETTKKQRGTRIELLLKKEEKEFLEKHTVRNTLLKYSKFVPFPIYIESEKVEVAEAIWTQPKSALKEKDYLDFYKFFENTQEEPETYLHLSSDAPVQFSAVLFIPKTSFEQMGLFKAEPGIDLYSRKVLIQKNSQEILPEYLRFVQGVIDSEEIPLNISRETIQNNIKIDRIKKYLLKQLFAHLKKLKTKDREKYLRIWDNFSRNLKEGIATDFANKEKIAPLLLFYSSDKGSQEFTDLHQYKERMAKDQNEIYTLTGMDLEAIAKNPALEAFQKKNLEVLYLDDPLDEFVIEHLGEYEGKPFKKAQSADIKLEREKDQDKKQLQDVAAFTSYLKNLYGDKVSDVKMSNRLTDSPCMLTHPADGPSVQVEKIIKMTNKDYQFSKKILEINPDNALIGSMIRAYKIRPASKDLEQIAQQLLDNLLLQEGILENIDSVVPRMQQIMLRAAKSIKAAPKSKTKTVKK